MNRKPSLSPYRFLLFHEHSLLQTCCQERTSKETNRKHPSSSQSPPSQTRSQASLPTPSKYTASCPLTQSARQVLPRPTGSVLGNALRLPLTQPSLPYPSALDTRCNTAGRSESTPRGEEPARDSGPPSLADRPAQSFSIAYHSPVHTTSHTPRNASTSIVSSAWQHIENSGARQFASSA